MHPASPGIVFYAMLVKLWYRLMFGIFNPIHPIGNNLKKQKPCTDVSRLVLKPPYKIP